MAKKQWFFLAVFVMLAAFFVYAFTDWGRRPGMQISHAASVRKPNANAKPRARNNNTNLPVMRFNLDRAYPLTEVKVVRLSEWRTNPLALPLWHLITDSNSVPTRRFNYGAPLRGMKPIAPRVRPQPLETNVGYRLFLTAGPVQGQHDFTLPSK
jgi:hypothetical protein